MTHWKLPHLAAIATLLFGLSACGKLNTPAVDISKTSTDPGANQSVFVFPKTLTVTVGGTATFTAAGGAAPYTYSIVSGGGSIDAAKGVFTAPSWAGTVVIEAVDAGGGFGFATVTVANALQISPATLTILANGTYNFSASGGSIPYSFSVVSGGGSITNSGQYLAPALSGTATVRVTDASGSTSDSAVTVSPALSLFPSSVSVLTSSMVSFTGAGGIGAYTFSISSGAGAISPTGVYTAPASPGFASVRVVDTAGNVKESSVTITAAAGGAPAVISVFPTSRSVPVSGTYTFTASGGTPPYTWAVISGTGSINASGVFTATAVTGTAVVRATDSASGTPGFASITVTPGLQISPASATIMAGATQNFSANGGTAPYSYSIVSGGGSVTSAGAFIAPNASGTTVVRVTDSNGATSDSSITVNNVLQLAPTSLTLVTGATGAFTASGGVGTLSYSIVSGGGSVSPTGLYTAPGTNGTAIVRVTDTSGNTRDASITINPALAIVPASFTVQVSQSYTLNATGGVPPYTYTLTSGAGSVSLVSGVYTAPGSAGSATITVTDASGSTQASTATITAAPGAVATVNVLPGTKTLPVNGSYTFTAVGGTPPYTWSVVGGTGTINSSGVFTANSTTGTTIIKAADSVGSNPGFSTLTVTPALAISPATITLMVGNTYNFSAGGGTAPYTYAIFSGGGSITSGGAFTAPSSAGTTDVRVTDANGATSDSTVTVNSALQLSPAALTLVTGGTGAFVASGGVGSKAYAVVSGTGTISATGVYTAPGSYGSAQVRVTDANGNAAQSTVSINPPLALAPTGFSVQEGSTYTLNASGGIPPYTYSIASGGGSVSVLSGVFTAPGTAGTTVIQVTDSAGTSQSATATVTPPPGSQATVTVLPASRSVPAGGNFTFTASGGTPPYAWAVISGTGSVNSSGLFTANAVTGTTILKATDSAGSNPGFATVTVTPALAISPSSLTVMAGSTYNFNASGGTSPYSYSIVSGGGSISTNGVFLVPPTAGTTVVQVTDANGSTSSSTVTVNPVLALTPGSLTLVTGATGQFTGSGGVGALTYSVVSGTGSITAGGVYTAPGSMGTATIQVADTAGNLKTASITINPQLAIAPTGFSVEVSQSYGLNATGGVPPYTYSVISGGGSVSLTSGVYAAPASAGTATVRVTDSAGVHQDATATITAAAGNVATVSVLPSSRSVPVSGSYTFTASGGTPPYAWSVISGTGSINSSGVFTANSTTGTTIIKATDSISSNPGFATITVTPALAISPATLTLMVGNTYNFSSSGGTAPYTYSISSGGGSVTSAGAFTAPVAAGTTVVQVTDANGATSTSTVTVNAAIGLSPSTLTLVTGSTGQFTGSGGVGALTYSVISGTGTVNASGVYTAPGSAGTATIQVADTLGNTRTASVTTNLPLAIAPTGFSVQASQTYSLNASGGVPPYTYSVISGGGSISTSNGIYSAPTAAGSATIRVTDSAGNHQDSSATITAPPGSVATVAVLPDSHSVQVNGSYTFTASGGTPPYTWSVISGTGSINSSGLFTAAAVTGTSIVKAVDSVGSNPGFATVTVTPALVISPATLGLMVGNTYNFSSSGGTAPYTYSITSGAGSISSAGAFTAPSTTGTTVVQVTDANGSTSSSTVTISGALQLSPSSLTLVTGTTGLFTGAGGVGALSYSVVSGTGSITSGGVYTAPGSMGTATVQVADTAGNTKTAAITINPALAIAPTGFSVQANQTYGLNASGGVPPYTYSVISGGGSVSLLSGIYSAPAAAGTATVRVTDSAGNHQDSAATITAAPGSVATVTVFPSTKSVPVNGAYTFTASAGTPPYTWSVVSGTGTINSSGVFTAAAVTGTTIIKAVDSVSSNPGYSTITVTPALTISPSSVTLMAGNTYNFSASGGTSPYSYSIVSGGGSISSAGAFTAGASAGTTTVQVTDANGSTSTSTVTVNSTLSLSPSALTLITGTTGQFTAAGGVGSLTYSVISGTGTVSGAGLYTAPATMGTATVQVADTNGNTKTASITINPALAIAPTGFSVQASQTYGLNATGGVPPYSYSVVSGGGSISLTTGVYAAPATAGTATVRVTDAAGSHQDSAVTITAAPGSVANLAVLPASRNVPANGSFTFVGSGGTPPYTWAVISGTGTINSSGVFTANSTTGTTIIKVTDTVSSNPGYATITVTPALAISPSSLTLMVGNSYNFNASGGTAPYTYSITAGGGSISSAGAFTAPAAAGSTTVQVTDANGSTSSATVTTNAALALSPSSATVIVNTANAFSGSGGVGTLTYSITAGTGTISSTGVYTAPSTMGSATVQVADTVGNAKTASVTINPALSIAPTSFAVQVNSNFTVAGQGGVPPYSYTVVAGGGSVGLLSGVYTAPGAAGSATVRVTDSAGSHQDSTATVSTVGGGGAAATKLMLSGAGSLSTGVCGTYSVILGDSNNNSFVATSQVQANLAGSGSGSFYSNSGCTTAVTGVTIPTGSALANFYFKDASGESLLFVASATGLSLSTLPVTVNGAGSNAGPATKLAFVTQPSSVATVSVNFAQQPIVAVEDTNNNIVTSSTASITLTAYTDSQCTVLAGGSLGATQNPVTASGGEATFAGVNEANPQTIYIGASASGLAPACSTAIQVNSASATKLAFTVEPPATATAGSGFSTQPQVSIENATGSVVTGATNRVTLAVYLDSQCTQPAGGTFTVALNPMSPTNGVVAFSGVSETLATTLYLGASSPGLASACSTGVTVSPAPAAQLIYFAQPSSNAGAGVNFAQQPQITVVDAYNNIVSSGDTIALAAYTQVGCTGPTGAGFSNNSLAAISGNAVFTGVNMQSTGTYYIKATDTSNGAVAPACSLSVTVGPGTPTKLVFTTAPTSTAYTYLYLPTQPVVTIEDTYGNPVPLASASVTIGAYTDGACGTTSPTGSFVAGTNPLPTTNGVAAFSKVYETTVQSMYIGATATGLTKACFGPVTVNGSGPLVTQGDNHGCAVNAAGNVFCWGLGTSGQLGQGNSTTSNIPVQVKGPSGSSAPFLSNIVAVSAGSTSTCALSAPIFGGNVYCWGNNGSGQAGVNSTLTSSYNIPQPVVGTSGSGALSGITSISAGNGYNCAADGTNGYCWGAGGNSQLANGGGNSSKPTIIKGVGGTGTLANVTAISAGVYETCAVAGGNVYCWGYNQCYSGLFGTNDSSCVTNTYPVKVCSNTACSSYLSGMSMVAVGYATVCAAANGGGAYCWGTGSALSTGIGTTQTVAASGVKGPGGTGALTGITSLSVSYGAANGAVCTTMTDGSVYCWGYGTNFEVGNNANSTASQSYPTQNISILNALWVGANGGSSGQTFCAVNKSGNVYCWGQDTNGQFGTGGGASTAIAQQVLSGAGGLGGGAAGVLTAVTGVASGQSHSCAVKSNGNVSCWGYNLTGQLGTGGATGTVSTLPVTVVGVGGTGSLSSIVQVTAGSGHSCGLSAAGNVFCWGWNKYGQLGTGGTADSSSPVEVVGVGGAGFLGGITSIAAGANHTCATNTSGNVLCWGFNDRGQLGLNMFTNQATPEYVLNPAGTANLTGIASVAGGNEHTCAVATSGGVYCWGYNSTGQLGVAGSTGNTKLPVTVSDVSGTLNLGGITQVAAGTSHTCAVTSGGNVYCWGDDSNYELGGSTSVPAWSTTPIEVLLGGVALYGIDSVTAGNMNSCATTSGGAVFCWGVNTNGAVGVGNLTASQYATATQVVGPGNVGNLANILGISLGALATHSCGYTTGGLEYCWGDDTTGDLGKNTNGSPTGSPTQVITTATGSVLQLW